jgi:hypothetical protein
MTLHEMDVLAETITRLRVRGKYENVVKYNLRPGQNRYWAHYYSNLDVLPLA